MYISQATQRARSSAGVGRFDYAETVLNINLNGESFLSPSDVVNQPWGVVN